MYLFQNPASAERGAGQSKLGNYQSAAPMIYYAQVTSIDDETHGYRIFAKIPGIDVDNSITPIKDKDEAIMALPLLPMNISIFPQKGDSVFIFIQNTQKKHGERFWLGPITSQPQFLRNDPFFFGSTSTRKVGAMTIPDISIDIVGRANGVFPKQNEIAIQGKDNSDILFRPKQVVLRAGKAENLIPNNSRIPTFNSKNPAYFKLAYYVPINNTNPKNVEYGSIGAMVANKLLLLTHKKTEFEYNITAPNEEITESSLLSIINNAESAVYGDTLRQFLELVKLYLKNHTHYYAGMKSVPNQTAIEIEKFDLKTILAENIKIV